MSIQDLDRKMHTIGELVKAAFDHPDNVSFDNIPAWTEAAALADKLNFHFEAIGVSLRVEWSTSYSKYILLQE
jgi:hypothetical protein